SDSHVISQRTRRASLFLAWDRHPDRCDGCGGRDWHQPLQTPSAPHRLGHYWCWRRSCERREQMLTARAVAQMLVDACRGFRAQLSLAPGGERFAVEVLALRLAAIARAPRLAPLARGDR